MTPQEQLERITSMLNRLVDRIWFGQLDSPTPCGAYTVHDLIDRIIVVATQATPLLCGEPLRTVTPPAVYGWVPAQEFIEATNSVVESTRLPGTLDRQLSTPMGPMRGDQLVQHIALVWAVHGWDLARGTGLPWMLDDPLVTSLGDFARNGMCESTRDGDTFAYPRPVAHDAAAMDQLAAFVGRDV
jgi:uncharacterized protein (TIGR03086 family)